jgi:P27 family predicted phage terminase small subunit
MTIDAQKIYKKYNKQVRDYMENLVTSLTNQYGEINDEWRVSLDLIAYNYDIIIKCQKDIEENGFEKVDDRGRMSKNSCIAICNKSQEILIKLLSAFGLNIMSKSKLRNIDTTNDETLEDLLD